MKWTRYFWNIIKQTTWRRCWIIFLSNDMWNLFLNFAALFSSFLINMTIKSTKTRQHLEEWNLCMLLILLHYYVSVFLFYYVIVMLTKDRLRLIKLLPSISWYRGLWHCDSIWTSRSFHVHFTCRLVCHLLKKMS